MSMRRWAGLLFGAEVLAWAVWLGGMVVIAIAAPVVFQTIASRDLAGRVFGAILSRFFPIAYACGSVILCAGAARIAMGRRIGWLESARYGVVVVMLGITLYIGIAVLGEMTIIQASLPGPIETLPLDSGPRARFDQLHKLSERLMGIDVFLGLILLPLLLVRGRSYREASPVGHPAHSLT